MRDDFPTMAKVEIQLSDKTLERLRAHADALKISPEQVVTEAVEDLLDSPDPWLGFATEAEYQAWIQEGLDSAENEPLIDADVVFEKAQKRLSALLASNKA